VSGELRLNAELGRQRSEALRLAQSDLETLRGDTDIAAGVAELEPADGLPFNTSFHLVRDVSPATASTRPRSRCAGSTGGGGRSSSGCNR
jgi:hypothetical protein